MRASFFILCLALCLRTAAAADTAVVDGIKSVVSSRIVTFSEVEDYSRPAVDALRRQYFSQPEVYQQKVSQTLDDSMQQLVERLLILHSFDTEGYKSLVRQFLIDNKLLTLDS